MQRNNEICSLDGVITGVFIKELNNRFRGLVYINGAQEICYIPSSCKLSKLVSLSNKQVLLQPVELSGTGVKYSLLAVRYRNTYIILNSGLANRIVEHQLSRRFFCALGPREKVRREVLVDGYKCDLFIEDTDTVVEVKSIISSNKVAEAFTVRSDRAVIQLKQLLGRLDSKSAAYIFVVMSPTVQEIHINRDSEAGNILYSCYRNGLKLLGVSAGLTNQGFALKKTIPITFT